MTRAGRHLHAAVDGTLRVAFADCPCGLSALRSTLMQPSPEDPRDVALQARTLELQRRMPLAWFAR